MTKLDFDFFGAYVFALIVLGALVAAGIAYGQPMIVFLAVLSAGFGWLSSVAQIWQSYFDRPDRGWLAIAIFVTVLASDGAAALGMTIFLFRVVL